MHKDKNIPLLYENVHVCLGHLYMIDVKSCFIISLWAILWFNVQSTNMSCREGQLTWPHFSRTGLEISERILRNQKLTIGLDSYSRQFFLFIYLDPIWIYIYEGWSKSSFLFLIQTKLRILSQFCDVHIEIKFICSKWKLFEMQLWRHSLWHVTSRDIP